MDPAGEGCGLLSIIDVDRKVPQVGVDLSRSVPGGRGRPPRTRRRRCRGGSCKQWRQRGDRLSHSIQFGRGRGGCRVVPRAMRQLAFRQINKLLPRREEVRGPQPSLTCAPPAADRRCRTTRPEAGRPTLPAPILIPQRGRGPRPNKKREGEKGPRLPFSSTYLHAARSGSAPSHNQTPAARFREMSQPSRRPAVRGPPMYAP